jgi:hypothetical protein
MFYNNTSQICVVKVDMLDIHHTVCSETFYLLMSSMDWRTDMEMIDLISVIKPRLIID